MYASLSNVAGNQPFNDWFVPDTTQRFALGTKIDAVDPFWGFGEFIYGKAGAALPRGQVSVFDQTWTAAGIPDAANQGFPIVIAMARFPIDTYGWFARSGLLVCRASGAAVSAGDPLGITALGCIGAVSAGKQILGVRARLGQAGTKVLSGQTTTGSAALFFPSGYDGMFLGIALSGTGVPAATVAAQMMPDGKTIIMGSAVGTAGDKVATATGQVSITGTYTGFIIVQAQCPFAQGQIT